MKPISNLAEARRASSPEHSPESLTPENHSHLRHGGVFVPDPRLYMDLDLPTRSFSSCREIGAGVVKFTAEVPEEIIDPIPALLFHGYCGSEKAYEKLRNAIARNGKVAVTYETPRVQRRFAGLHPKHLAHPARLLSQAPWVIMKEGLEDASELADINLAECIYDAYTHSMGGPTSVGLAQLHPDRFRSLYLDEPAGLEPHNTPMMIGRLGNFSNHELRKVKDPALLAHSLLSMARNPFRLATEGIMVSNCNIQDGLIDIKEQGVKTAAMFGTSDSLISAYRSITHSSHIPHLVGVHFDNRAHHLWPQTNPFDAAMAFRQALNYLHMSHSEADRPPEVALVA